MTALFKNQQHGNLPARDRRDWNEVESLGELHGLIANDGYAASFQDLGQYRSALVRYMGNVLRRLATGRSTVRAWRERMGKPADWPLHAPTDVERAMVSEIAELRAHQAAAPSALYSYMGIDWSTDYLTEQRAAMRDQAAQLAESYGPSRLIAKARPSETIQGRWEGEQAASSNIAAAIRALDPAPRPAQLDGGHGANL